MEISLEHYNKMVERLTGLEYRLAERQWILCSEKLPDIGTEVLVTDCEMMWVCNLFESSDDGRYQWEDNYGYWHELDTWDAWMPLPPPLKEVTK